MPLGKICENFRNSECNSENLAEIMEELKTIAKTMKKF